MGRLKDETGNRYGHLIVLERSSNDSSNKTRWVVQCDCGNTTVTTGDNLRRGNSTSCGCAKGEKISKAKTRHGRCRTDVYLAWVNLKTRCYNKKYELYHRYGGRGIKVCDRWLNSFESFLEDMGEKPGKNYSIERTDLDGDYTPENCKWATAKEQSNNRSTNNFYEFNGKALTLPQWSEETGLSLVMLRSRIARGWDIEKTLTTPKRTRGGKVDRYKNKKPPVKEA